MTECDKAQINNYKTTQHLYCNLAVPKTFSDRWTITENTQNLRSAQPRMKDKSNSDNRVMYCDKGTTSGTNEVFYK